MSKSGLFTVEWVRSEAFAALDPTEEIIVYCADVHYAASIYAYHHLERAGYTRVHRYAGGTADWEQAGYPLESGPRTDRSLERSRRRTSTSQAARTDEDDQAVARLHVSAPAATVGSSGSFQEERGAGGGTRTHGLFLTRELLYQLSYSGVA